MDQDPLKAQSPALRDDPSPTVMTGVRRAAAARPDSIAVVDEARSLTFAALVDRADRVAAGAATELGLRRGAYAGLLAYNCLEYIEIVLGLAAAGAPAVLLNARLSPVELGHTFDDCDLSLLFVHPALRGLAEAAVDGRRIRIVEIGPDYEAWLARASAVASPPMTGEDIFMVASTGGTTGRSKGVMLSERSRTAMYRTMRDVLGCYGPDDRNLAVAPLFHGSGFNFAFATVYFGGAVVIAGKFDPEATWTRLADNRITNASVVPTHLAAMFGLGEDRVRSFDTGALRALICNGAPLPVSIKQFGAELWDGKVLSEAYGSTEGGIVSTMPAAHLLERPASVGQIFPGVEAQVVKEDGALAGAGEMGALRTRSPYHFSGFVGGPAHAQTDWFAMGDVAQIDGAGFLFLLDRQDEKIISGGVNIYPAEVELAIADHPAVAEVAVFGVPDAYWGEAVHALVSLAPGAVVTAEELRTFAGARVGRLKTPKTVGFRDALPKSAAGKVLRRVLRDEHRAERAAKADNGE